MKAGKLAGNATICLSFRQWLWPLECVCVRVCLRERGDRERKREGERKSEGHRLDLWRESRKVLWEWRTALEMLRKNKISQ